MQDTDQEKGSADDDGLSLNIQLMLQMTQMEQETILLIASVITNAVLALFALITIMTQYLPFLGNYSMNTMTS